MLKELKEQVYEANMQLPAYQLVTFTWGNVSGIDRERGLFVIKPSGVKYEDLRPEQMVVVDLDGKVVDGELNPSTDTATHAVLYRAFDRVGGIVHTHSTYAVAYAQAGCAIPFYGTTHADYFHGPVPCARSLTPEEVETAYEENTGHAIVEALAGQDPLHMPGAVCRHHGPFTWGKDCFSAVYHAVVLEEIARMNILTKLVDPNVAEAPGYILEKHFQRKHGPNAYYGQ